VIYISLNKFKIVLYNKLSTYCTTFEYKAPSQAVFPYCVYNVSIQTIRHEGYLINNYVEIDIWDIGFDSVNIDNIRDSILKDFKDYRYSDEYICMKMNSIDTLSIQDPDENIIRKRIRINFIYSDKTIA